MSRFANVMNTPLGRLLHGKIGPVVPLRVVPRPIRPTVARLIAASGLPGPCRDCWWRRSAGRACGRRRRWPLLPSWPATFATAWRLASPRAIWWPASAPLGAPPG